MKKKALTAAVIAALFMTACGSSTVGDQGSVQETGQAQDTLDEANKTETGTDAENVGTEDTEAGDTAAETEGPGAEYADTESAVSEAENPESADAGSEDSSTEEAQTLSDEADPSQEEEVESSPFILWGYEGYVDECKGYTWQDEFKDCDYDGDGKTDRVNRSWDEDEQTAVYTVEFGNGDTITVPKGWETGFPHVQGGDLDGDGVKEILVTLSYDTSTDPYAFGDMWLFDRDETSGQYSEVTLPFADGENGAKCFSIEYDKPDGGTISYKIKEAGFSREEDLGVDYISSWWTNEATSEMRSIYWAEIKDGTSPVVRCYVEPFPRGVSSLGFDLNYNNGKYEIGNFENEYSEHF